MGVIGSGEMSPMNYLKIFFRRKEIIIIPTFIGLVIGVCAGILLPKQYQSSTLLLVEEGKTDNPLFDKLAVSTTVQQRISTIRESMLGWNSLVKLVRRLNMDKDVKTPREFEDLIQGIKDNAKITMKGPNIIDLAYSGRDPELTQAVVKTITEIFIERNVEVQNQETSDAIVFIEEQLKLYRGKIKSAEIAQLKDELKTLMLDATEFHPKVKELKDQISAREEELRQENLEYSEDVMLDTSTTTPIIRSIRDALENIEGGGTITAGYSHASPQQDQGTESELYRVMLIEKLDNVMARDVGVNTGIYNMLLQRLETAKITERLQSSKEGTKYTILDPPRIPLDPVKPNKVIVGLVGLLLGALLGFGLVVFFEFMDRSFIDVEEAKQFLGVPLLGAISKITTEDNLRKEKERKGWMYSLTGVAGVVLVILTTAVANFLR